MKTLIIRAQVPDEFDETGDFFAEDITNIEILQPPTDEETDKNFGQMTEKRNDVVREDYYEGLYDGSDWLRAKIWEEKP